MTIFASTGPEEVGVLETLPGDQMIVQLLGEWPFPPHDATEIAVDMYVNSEGDGLLTDSNGALTLRRAAAYDSANERGWRRG